MRISPARRLILVYILLAALVFAYAPFTNDLGSTASGTLFWLAVEGLIVRGLWKGSQTAWVFAVILDVLMILSLILMAFPFGLTPLLVLSVGFGHLAILFSPTVLAHTRARADAGLASS